MDRELPGDAFQQNRMRRSSGNANHRYHNNNSHSSSSPHQNHRRSSRNRERDPKPQSHNLPLEQGRIHTLLDNFGFIYCAERPTDLFFHYSEVMGIHPDDLRCGDEVQFYVGPRSTNRGSRRNVSSDGDEKEQLSAYGVKVLEEGSVVWEVEDEPGVRKLGRVERMVRYNHNHGGRDKDGAGGSAGLGTIRLLPDDDKGASDGEPTAGAEAEAEAGAEAEADSKGDNVKLNPVSPGKMPKSKPPKGLLVRYTINDYVMPKSKSRSDQLLSRNDLVSFTLVTEKRSGIKYARDITMVQSERARLEEEREKKMLEDATLEQGVVVSLKNGFGFLRSNRRREEVYFHFTHILLPEPEQEGHGEQGEDHANEEQHHTLVEGQDMEFLVVSENGKLGARQVKFLPRGTVMFEQVLARGVTGTLSLAPRHFASSNSGRRGGKNAGRESQGGLGEVVLSKPIKFIPGSEGDGDGMITEVSVDHTDFQGFMKDEPKPEWWFKVGDMLRFDVVRDVVDGNCRIAPTKCRTDGCEDAAEKARIRLVEPSLSGRAEGIVTAIRDNYGFVQLAHRNADAYFRLSEVFPLSMQQDLYPQDSDASGAHVSIGAEVTFDLSLLPPKGGRSSRNGSGGRHNRRGGEKEQLRASRLAILPPGTLKLTKETEVTGKITRILRNSFTGQIALDKKVKAMSRTDQYPLMTKLVDQFISNSSKQSLNFQEVQSEIENDIILDLVENRAGVEVHFVPVSDFSEVNRGRLCIRKIDKKDRDSQSSSKGEDVMVPSTDEIPKNQDEDVANDFDETLDLEAEDAADNVSDNEDDVDADAAADDRDCQAPSKKKSRKKTRTIRSVTFEKHSLAAPYVADLPMSGDKVSMKVIFSRCTGKFTVSDMTLVERTEPVAQAVKYNLCEGYVLLEPVHTAFKESKSRRRGFEGGGWGSDEKVEDHGKSNEDGKILLTFDPAGLYKVGNSSQSARKTCIEEGTVKEEANTPDKIDVSDGTKDTEEAKESKYDNKQDVEVDLSAQNSHIGQHIPYAIANLGGRNSSDAPKRGDLVTFVRGKNGKGKDIRVKKKAAATKVEGILIGAEADDENAKFQSVSDKQMFEVSLSEVVGCDLKVLKKDETVEALMYEGRIVGICRKADLYLESAIGSRLKERPKLNLTVKKELKGLGGKIIAQSGMAKGPDGSCGFCAGWTNRKSKFTAEVLLNKDAEPFIFDVPAKQSEEETPENSDGNAEHFTEK